MTQEMRLLSVEQLRFVSDTAYGAGVRASQDELRRLQSVNAQLLEALEEAADDIESWGAYATEYFQKRHNLQGAVNKARAAIAAAKDSNAA
jgi:hypothetical protein